MITVEGLYGIKATVLADSISPQGKRFTTLEIEYPRIILAELNTHRMLSKNSFSSRAVPFKKMLDNLRGRPVRFGANQAGMQDKGEDYNHPVLVNGSAEMSPANAWQQAMESAIGYAKSFSDAGYHKQVFNRLLEPWQMMKTVISGTEWANFEWLRDHDAADPTFHELARVIREAKALSNPTPLDAGMWHLPYVDSFIVQRDGGRFQAFHLADGSGSSTPLKLEDAIKVSCARCAAVSYRNEGYGLEKSLEVYENLVGADRKHASAFEHQATPMAESVEDVSDDNYLDVDGSINLKYCANTWEPGITHVDRKGQLWSGNLCGFIQYRKLIPGENYEG